MASFILPIIEANAMRQKGTAPQANLVGAGLDALRRYKARKAMQNDSQALTPMPMAQPDMQTDDEQFGGEPDSLARGKIVTTPTIARLGDRGPEAVIPLNSHVGAHVRPDMLEGHLQAPKVQGIRYQQAKGFVKPSY